MPPRQLSSFAHCRLGALVYKRSCRGIPFPTGMTCCKTGDGKANLIQLSGACISPRGGCVAPPTFSILGPTDSTSALHAIVAGGSHGPNTNTSRIDGGGDHCRLSQRRLFLCEESTSCEFLEGFVKRYAKSCRDEGISTPSDAAAGAL